MNLSKQIITPFLFILLAPVFVIAQLAEVCDGDSVSLGAVEVDWRTFAPENRFEVSHYLIPPVQDYVTLQDTLGYASDAVALSVLLIQAQGGKGTEPYIDNYIRSSLGTAFSLLVAYEWSAGFSMHDLVDSLEQVAKAWLPGAPHARIGDVAPCYERFDSEYHKQAALEIEKLCKDALSSHDPEAIYCALEPALSTAVVAITGSKEEADVFVKRLEDYTIPCGADGFCLAGADEQQFSNLLYPNGTLPAVPQRLSYEEASADQELFPLNKEQVERGLAYYFQHLHEEGLDGVALGFGARIAKVAKDPARLKKLTSAGANAGKFVAGYSLYCNAVLEASDEPKKAPLSAFSRGSKVPIVNGLSFANRFVALVSAGTKCWSSYEAWSNAWDDQDAAARFKRSSEALDIALNDAGEEMDRLKEDIAVAAKESRLRDSMALVDAYEETSRAYNYLKERKALMDQNALAASAALGDADAELFMAQWWGLSSSAVGGVDALLRFLSSGMKLSLQLASNRGWILETSAESLRKGFPDALEKISPALSTLLITSSIVLGVGEAYDMYNVQTSASSVLSLPHGVLDPELHAALSAAQNQDWTAWGASLMFNVLKDARNLIAIMVSWGFVDFFAHHVGWNPDVSRAKNIVTIWSLTLINAVIPTYWKWSEETETEAEKLDRQALLAAIRDALEGHGDSSKYKEVCDRIVASIATSGKVVDTALVNSIAISQLLHELIEHDSRYASYVMLDRYREGDPNVERFFNELGLSSEQLDSLRLAPSELWLKSLDEEERVRKALLGVEAGSINFINKRIKG